MQTSSHNSTAIWARRLGLIAILLTLFVFASEAVLAGLRVRELDISFSVAASPDSGSANSATAVTPTPAAATPRADLLFARPTDQLVVNVRWNYRIGPRFQKTTVRASARIESRIIAQGSYLIDCGTAILDCTGSSAISLRYTIPDTGNGPQYVPWPAGDYTVIVERSFGGLQYSDVQQADFRVETP